jgi:membrane-associated phospholipid phosphatase
LIRARAGGFAALASRFVAAPALHCAAAMDSSTAIAPARPGWLWQLTYHLGLDLIFLGVFASLLVVLMGVYGGRPTFLQTSIVLPLAIMTLLIAVGLVRRRGRTLALVRDWLPLILIVLVYENFHDLTDLVRPETVDGVLRRLDERLLGVEPALALSPISRPWLTEYMTFCYALYFVYPTIVLATLYARGEFVRFREFGLALSLAFYLGLFGYVLVPAIGPRYALAAELGRPLDGIWLTARAAAAWDALESVKRDCFPSLHTALTTISLVYFWRYRNTWKWGRFLLFVCAPLIFSLWCSTIYLRYHYLVDVLAGFALAFFCCSAAPALVRAYYAGRLGRQPAQGAAREASA